MNGGVVVYEIESLTKLKIGGGGVKKTRHFWREKIKEQAVK